MFNFARLENEFQLIRNSPYTPASKLSTLYDVTERTIRSDIAAINQALEHHGAAVLLRRKAGYYLDITDSAAFAAFEGQVKPIKPAPLDLTTASNRMRVVIKALLDSDDYIRHADIAAIALVGESTIQSYIRQIKVIFNRYDIECVTHRSRGVRAYGSERDKRTCYFSEVVTGGEDSRLSGFSQDDRKLFTEIDLDELERATIEALSEEGLVATDLGLTNLVLNIALLIKRESEGHVIETRWIAHIPEDAAAVVNTIADRIEVEGMTQLPDSERDWLYLQLLTYTDLGTSSIDVKQLNGLIDQLLECIHDNYGFDFQSDYLLRTGLIEHLKSTFKRTDDADRAWQNPLTSTIKRSFPLAFEISLASTNEMFAHVPLTLSEGDISYIALHIGAAIERTRSALYKKQRAIIVCDAGRAALGVLAARINTLFADRIEEVSSMSKQGFLLLSPQDLADIDLIITTTTLIESSIASITVDFRLLDDDIKSISHWLETSNVWHAKYLDKYFKASTFEIIDGPVSKREVLERMCAGLVDDGIAEDNLLDLVLERECISATSISERMAIPHPIRPCSQETRIAVAMLRHPVNWSEGVEKDDQHSGRAGNDEPCRVRLVFLLSMKPQSAAEISKLYDVLTNVANDEETQSKLIQSQSFAEFMRALGAIGA